MTTLHVVGIGSLGSNFLLELAKRCYAIDYPLDIHLYDDDIVESRNVAAQAFSPQDLGKFKADAITELLYSYGKGINATSHVGRITKDNINFEQGNSIIIDMVDNIETRWLLWEYGLLYNIPVLHAGLSNTGAGTVEWSWQDIDTFSLSKANMAPAKQKAILEAPEKESLPPCELNAFRSVSLNTVLAALNALFIFLGKDITKEFAEELDGDELPGIMSTWVTDTKSMKCIKEMTAIKEFNNAE
jgi:ThiF family